MTMENAVGETAKEYATQAWLAYDQDFLYIALRCQHPVGRSVPPEKTLKVPAASTVAPKSVPPEDTVSMPPLLTVVLPE